MKNTFQFHGRGEEYFGIWIVNVLLTIVTLGLYSPWAHVRNKQYFYGNTELDGDRFEYLATGKQVFLGRLIAAILFLVYVLLSNTLPIASFAILVFMFAVFPWVAKRSLSFNARMTRYRGVSLGFNGSTKDAYINFLGKPVLAYLMLGGLAAGLAWVAQQIAGSKNTSRVSENNWGMVVLAVILFLGLIVLAFYAYAWVKRGVDSYVHNGYRYGQQQFFAHLETKTYAKIYGTGALIFLLVQIVFTAVAAAITYFLLKGETNSQAAMATFAPVLGLVGFLSYIGFFALVLYISALIFSKTRNYKYNQTTIGATKAYQFVSTVKPGAYVGLMFINAFMMIFSLGLLTPFVKVRVADFLARHTAIEGNLSALVAQEQEQAKGSATADALGDFFDLDIQF